jgi:hypothetical protein
VWLGLPQSKFLISILNYLRCELVHLNPNVITALSCFNMMCECSLGIPPDTSMFWYFYYPTHYDKQVFSGIGLTLRHNRRGEYLNTGFKGYWKDASQRWFHVDTHAEPPWQNNNLLPPLIENKQKEPEMTPCLEAPVKWVTELRQVGPEVCHCIEDFTLRWIRPLSHREKLAFECPQLADPNRDLSASKILNLVLWVCTNIVVW